MIGILCFLVAVLVIINVALAMSIRAALDVFLRPAVRDDVDFDENTFEYGSPEWKVREGLSQLDHASGARKYAWDIEHADKLNAKLIEEIKRTRKLEKDLSG